jgi:hypothetical protein
MTDQTEAPVPEGERLCDFWERLHSEGVDMKHVHQMLDRLTRERAEAIANASRLYYRDAAGELIKDAVCSERNNLVNKKLAAEQFRARGLGMTEQGLQFLLRRRTNSLS